MKVKFGFRVFMEIKFKSCESIAFSFMHSGEVQIVGVNRPDEVPEFGVFCDTYSFDHCAFFGIVAHGNSSSCVRFRCCFESWKGPIC